MTDPPSDPTPPDGAESAPAPAPSRCADLLRGMDHWMHLHPWHPRVAPWGVYLLFLMLITFASDAWPASYPVLYVIQCTIVLWMLVRYRRLTPELTLRFHWLAIPAGLGVAWLWIFAGEQIAQRFPDAFGQAGVVPFFDEQRMGPVVGWIAMVLRLVGMSLVVPMFEELFNRSLLLRSFHRRRPTTRGVLQIIMDFPIVGEWLMHTKVGERADKEPTAFGHEFKATPFGRLSVFGVVASTIVFVAVHHPRDWPACFICGIVYCLVVGATRSRGLGPVIWTHGITNAALWAYTLYMHYTTEAGSQLWRFL